MRSLWSDDVRRGVGDLRERGSVHGRGVRSDPARGGRGGFFGSGDQAGSSCFYHASDRARELCGCHDGGQRRARLSSFGKALFTGHSARCNHCRGTPEGFDGGRKGPVARNLGRGGQCFDRNFGHGEAKVFRAGQAGQEAGRGNRKEIGIPTPLAGGNGRGVFADGINHFARGGSRERISKKEVAAPDHRFGRQIPSSDRSLARTHSPSRRGS